MGFRHHRRPQRRIPPAHLTRATAAPCPRDRTASFEGTLPHALRPVDAGDDALAELGVLVGCGDELAAEATRVSNRIRGLLTGIHPGGGHGSGERVADTAVRETKEETGIDIEVTGLVDTYPNPTARSPISARFERE